jgi:hypothetical protein
MDEILDLAQRYWWLIGVVLLRFVLSSKGKKKKTEEVDNKSKPKSQLQEYLERMRAEMAEPEPASSQPFSRETPLPREMPFSSDEDDAAFLGHVPNKQEQQAKLEKKMQQMQKAKAAAKALEAKRSFIISETYPPAESTEISLSANRVERKPFPENLEYLPPMQRALVFSEIFGTPKGFDY